MSWNCRLIGTFARERSVTSASARWPIISSSPAFSSPRSVGAQGILSSGWLEKSPPTVALRKAGKTETLWVIPDAGLLFERGRKAGSVAAFAGRAEWGRSQPLLIAGAVG